MSKRSQLEAIQRLGLPCPGFQSYSWEAFNKKENPALKGINFPVAVRSTFEDEDGVKESKAGHFKTLLNVDKQNLNTAIAAVFDAYPRQEAQEVIIQEMLDPLYSGVLFAFRNGVWKIEMAKGLGEQVVSGHIQPEMLILPRFLRADLWWSSIFDFWKPGLAISKKTKRALIHLSVGASRLLQHFEQAVHGLDIEFSITEEGIFFLQARPITTKNEEEQVLTSANHKEILPPQPSPLMTSIISEAGSELFNFYQSLDPSLPNRPFLIQAAEMPWINLSALLDTMVHWGLPTSLVAKSVGAVDFYKLSLRPWRFILKTPVFWRLFRKQWGVARQIRDWVKNKKVVLRLEQTERELLWQENPELAFQAWTKGFSQFYVELVTYMQLLTGAMAGPVSLADRMGLLSKQAAQMKQRSASTDYLNAFQELKKGIINRPSFLRRFGHRGFYESDIGQRRFWEYQEEDWRQLMGDVFNQMPIPSEIKHKQKNKRPSWLLRPVFQLIHTREWIRHMSMQFFWNFRQELQSQTQTRIGSDFNCWDFKQADLALLLVGEKSIFDMEAYTKGSGWDMNTFLVNREGRRMELKADKNDKRSAIGIYPGIVKGQVWRVDSASFQGLQMPPYTKVILVADALDPGWIPFFTEVDGVVSYIGGLLSHASIILREAGIPSITQISPDLDLEEGDWIEINGKNGKIRKLEEAEYAI